MIIRKFLVVCVLVLGLFENAIADLNSGLVAYYPFDGNANDASGDGNNAIEHGVIKYVEGINGKAAKFDGITTYMEIHSGMNFTSKMSISFYMKVESHNSAYIFQKGEGCPDGNPLYKGSSYFASIGGQYDGAYTSSGQDFLDIGVVGLNGNFFDNRIMASTNKQIPSSSFDHYVIIFNKNFFKVYINGILVNISAKYEHGGGGDTINISPSDFSEMHQTDATLKIGVNEGYCGYNHTYSNYFSGILDEVRFYNRVITESEIQEIYNGNSIPSSSSCTSSKAVAVSENLDIQIPSLNYTSLLGTQNLWVNLKYYGRSPNGEILWKLKDFGTNP